MKNELMINGKDAFATWGVRMGNGFLDAVGASVPMKANVENKSRLEHGKRVIIEENPKLDERDLTLVFTIEGDSPSDYQTKKKAFYEELYKQKIDIQVPENSSDIYHLIYRKGASYGQSIDRTFCKISVKFDEPNPSVRT